MWRRVTNYTKLYKGKRKDVQWDMPLHTCVKKYVRNFVTTYVYCVRPRDMNESLHIYEYRYVWMSHAACTLTYMYESCRMYKEIYELVVPQIFARHIWMSHAACVQTYMNKSCRMYKEIYEWVMPHVYRHIWMSHAACIQKYMNESCRIYIDIYEWVMPPVWVSHELTKRCAILEMRSRSYKLRA